MLALLARQVGSQILDDLFDRSYLHRALENLHQPPALVFAQRACLFDTHGVADARRVFLVVRLELGSVLVCSLVDAVTLQRLDGNDDSLLHLVAGDPPHLLLATATLIGLRGVRPLRVGWSARHTIRA